MSAGVARERKDDKDRGEVVKRNCNGMDMRRDIVTGMMAPFSEKWTTMS